MQSAFNYCLIITLDSRTGDTVGIVQTFRENWIMKCSPRVIGYLRWHLILGEVNGTRTTRNATDPPDRKNVLKSIWFLFRLYWILINFFGLGQERNMDDYYNKNSNDVKSQFKNVIGYELRSCLILVKLIISFFTWLICTSNFTTWNRSLHDI